MKNLLVLLVLSAMLAVPFVRAGRLPAQAGSPTQAKLVFVGDLMVGRYVGEAMQANGYDSPFASIKGFLSSADLAIGNLEGSLAQAGSPAIPPAYPDQPNLTGDARSAGALSRAGFDLLSLANNHANNSGPQGVWATVEALRQAGITPVGLNHSGRQEPVVKEVEGLRIAFLAYTTVLNGSGDGASYVDPNSPEDRDLIAREVADARQKADVVVVVMHWGSEYKAPPDSSEKDLARLLAQAGADLVVGAHPHVVQGMELVRGAERSTVVAYSLGNALFDQAAVPQTRQGFALQCTVDREGVKSARLVPLQIETGPSGYSMQLADDASGRAAVQRALPGTATTLQWKAMWDAAQKEPGLALAYFRPETTGSQASREDLGLGGPSPVSLQHGALTVSRAGASPSQAVWTSSSGWRVTAYTVGDANNDGHPDLIYTLWKRSLTWDRPPGGGMQVNMDGGAVLPHLFIDGLRNGVLVPLWHGSPRPAPVLAVAVAPIGDNGKWLLATLESSDPLVEKAPGHITLWEWTGGFGFELIAPVPGIYSQMWSDGRVLLFR